MPVQVGMAKEVMAKVKNIINDHVKRNGGNSDVCLLVTALEHVPIQMLLTKPTNTTSQANRKLETFFLSNFFTSHIKTQ